MEDPPVRGRTGQPVEPAQARRHHRGHRSRGRLGAATLGEAGYNVKVFCYQDSPRRAHSIAAQEGINAAKNYKEDGDSVYRLFYDTVKGGDYRARESNVYRLAEVSANIIDQCVAQGCRSPASTAASSTTARSVVCRCHAPSTRAARPGSSCSSARTRRWSGRSPRAPSSSSAARDARAHRRRRRARGIIARDLVTGAIETHIADVVVLASGGYGNVFYLSTNAMGSNVTATWRAHRKGAYMAKPCYTQIHPTCIPVSA